MFYLLFPYRLPLAGPEPFLQHEQPGQQLHGVGWVRGLRRGLQPVSRRLSRVRDGPQPLRLGGLGKHFRRSGRSVLSR